VGGLGIAGYAADDWLLKEHGVSVGLSEGRRLLAILSPGTSGRDVRALVRGLTDLSAKVRGGTLTLDPLPDAPGLHELGTEMACAPAEAFHGPAEAVRLEEAEGRIAAEMIAPAPPGVPRLVPGQRITATHVRWLVAQRDAGSFFLDPVDPAERRVRVTAPAQMPAR
jgi:arginine decarboxylase